MGTTVVAGKARGIVTAIGMETELGRIAGFLKTEEREPTPLQKRLVELGRVLIIACVVLVAIIFVLQLLRGEGLAQTFLMAVSLAVAAVPEGLPAVVTIALASGLHRMVKRNALIRRLASVETLGAVTVICSDKTGTLTRNEMTVTEIVAGERSYGVTGTGYNPEGEFVMRNSNHEHVDPRNRSRSHPGVEDRVMVQQLTTGSTGRRSTIFGKSSAIQPKARWWWRPGRRGFGANPITPLSMKFRSNRTVN